MPEDLATQVRSLSAVAEKGVLHATVCVYAAARSRQHSNSSSSSNIVCWAALSVRTCVRTGYVYLRMRGPVTRAYSPAKKKGVQEQDRDNTHQDSEKLLS